MVTEGRIQAFIADQVQLDGIRDLTTGKHPPQAHQGAVLLTVAGAIVEIRAEAIEIDNEVAMILVLAALD